jgi:hypothetical protein
MLSRPELLRPAQAKEPDFMAVLWNGQLASNATCKLNGS